MSWIEISSNKTNTKWTKLHSDEKLQTNMKYDVTLLLVHKICNHNKVTEFLSVLKN